MIAYKSGNGSNKEEAVIILGAKDETEGVDAEYIWLEQKYGKAEVDWEMNNQELIVEGNTQYDALGIKFPSGELKEFWFNISDFYGN